MSDTATDRRTDERTTVDDALTHWLCCMAPGSDGDTSVAFCGSLAVIDETDSESINCAVCADLSEQAGQGGHLP